MVRCGCFFDFLSLLMRELPESIYLYDLYDYRKFPYELYGYYNKNPYNT